MACFHPLDAWQCENGSVKFCIEQPPKAVRRLKLPCSQCIGCRLERSRQWAMRCVHEASLHDCDNSFVTLTYEDGKLPSLSLVYRDFQLFIKRLRKAKGRVRYYMAGEYGGENGRPHFHAILFGCAFVDREFFRELPSGAKLYKSAELERLWPHGYCSVGEVTFESAAYVARYATKSLLSGHDGKRQSVEEGFIDSDTGEFVPFVPEFNRMSLRGGIGQRWFERYKREVFGVDGGLDRVVVNGVEMRPPKYYDKLLERSDAFALEYVKFIRERDAGPGDDCTPDRLAVREAVVKSRLTFKKRSLA